MTIAKLFTTLIFVLGLALLLTRDVSAAGCSWSATGSCAAGQCWGRYDATEGQRCCDVGATSPSTQGGTCVCASGGAWKDAADPTKPCISSEGGGGTGSTIRNPVISDALQSVTSLSNYLGTFWQLAYIVAGILVLVYLIMGAIKYIISGGDEKAVTSAKTMMTNAVIGLIILAASYPIIKIVEVVFGIHILEITWPTVQ